MLEVTQKQVLTLLQALGIRPGDNLLVHSAIQFLGRPEEGSKTYFDALHTAICGSDPDGTLAVPTFNFGFAQGEPYDPEATPSRGMGVFSEYVRLQPGARRTQHVMQSLAVIGPHADDLAGRDTLSAFDPGSAFERLLELDFKLLLLGAGVNAISMIHYSEQRFQVPYRYWKEFTGQVRTHTGWETRTYRMYVRNLEVNPRLDLHKVQDLLHTRGQWESTPLNYGHISTCRLADFVAAADDLLATDRLALATNREEVLRRIQC